MSSSSRVALAFGIVVLQAMHTWIAVQASFLYPGSGFPFDVCKQNPSWGLYSAQLTYYNMQYGANGAVASSTFCFKIIVRNQACYTHINLMSACFDAVL